jgi:hypothetical protein
MTTATNRDREQYRKVRSLIAKVEDLKARRVAAVGPNVPRNLVPLWMRVGEHYQTGETKTTWI